MAAISAIYKYSVVYKYTASCFIVSVFALLYYGLAYSKVSYNQYVRPNNTPSGIKFVSHGFKRDNSTFQLQGTYISGDGQKLRKNSSEINLDSNLVDEIRKKYLNVKRYEFEVMSPRIKVKSVSCASLFDGDEVEKTRVASLMNVQQRQQLSPEFYIELTQTCYNFKRKRGYITKVLTKEEKEFPIAYTLVMFKDVEQVDRLLRAIYRPQNYYCVHIDLKTEAIVHQAMKGIVGCFDNVFISSRSTSVEWGTYSVLEPELLCMEGLWKYKKWKYFINLTGQEFPLKTNFDIVKILKAYKGANDLEGTVRRSNIIRWKAAGTPPGNITPVKGSVHIVVNRGFIDYILHNQTAKDFLEWSKKVDVPDETYFSSLNHNPHLGIPGSYLGEPETDPVTKPFLARFKNWGISPFSWPCFGQRVRLICIFGIGDLPLLRSRREMFANKFYWDYQPYALDCMEELHYNRTMDEYIGLRTFDDSYYHTLDFVKNKIPLPNSP